MEWQDYTVWAIVAVIGALLVRRAWRRLTGRRRGCCAGCGETHCSRKKEK